MREAENESFKVVLTLTKLAGDTMIALEISGVPFNKKKLYRTEPSKNKRKNMRWSSRKTGCGW